MTAADRSLRRLVRVLAQSLRAGRPSRGAGVARTAAEKALVTKARRWNADGNILGFGLGPKRTRNRIRYKEPSIIVFVGTKVGAGKLPGSRTIPPRLRIQRTGVTVLTDVIEIGGMAVLQAGMIHPGANAAHFSLSAGTVTALVRPANGPGGVLVLSCAHVFAPIGLTGPQIESPPDPSALTHTNVAANLVRAISLGTGASSANRIDAALGQPIPGIALQREIPGVGAISLVSTLESGQFQANGVRQLVGFGATSGRIDGDILAESVWTLMRDERGNLFRFTDVVAYRPRPLTQAGDSGMPVLRATAAGPELIGMHIGASTIRNTPIRAAFMVPISRVMGALQIQLA
jgi:hypothetical protein